MDIISKSIINVGSHQVKVSVIADCDSGPLDNGNVKELDYNPLEWNGEGTTFDYTDFALENFYHSAFFTVDNNWRNKRYFTLMESPKELQTYFSNMGYSKNDAWLKSVESLRSQATYIQDWFNDLWRYVGLTVEITESFTDDNGLIWSREIDWPHNSLWGIEWGLNDKETFFWLIPDLLPNGLNLTDEEIETLWLNLE